MCRVGKFQKIWKTCKTDACPHCGLREDSLHVWKCSHPSSKTVWENSIKNLHSALHKIDTDPDIITCTISYLHAWRYNHSLQLINSRTLQNILQLQDTIGARQFFKGWIHSGWEELQEQHCNKISSKRSSKCWTIALITKLWEVAWDLWDYRNAVYHDQQNKSLQEEKSSLDLQVRDLIQQMTLTGLRPKDRHLASITLERLLDFPRSQKIEWIQQTTLALAQSKRWHFHL
jgi:hypothetical protein